MVACPLTSIGSNSDDVRFPEHWSFFFANETDERTKFDIFQNAKTSWQTRLEMPKGVGRQILTIIIFFLSEGEFYGKNISFPKVPVQRLSPPFNGRITPASHLLLRWFFWKAETKTVSKIRSHLSEKLVPKDHFSTHLPYL